MSDFAKCKGLRHAVTAQNVTDTTIVFSSGIQGALKGAIVTVRTSAGVLVAWDGGITIVENRVTVDNAGAVDWSATDTIDLVTF